ncbi:MAG TPA: class F sortase [Roseiflexaceae bacterium]|nr:class F sortase [Roseiflexaceae bacterium]
MHRCTLLIAMLLVAILLPTAPVEAQTTRRCFAETGYCISGRLREYWEQHGGLPVFGLPITPQQHDMIEGGWLQVQWFERARLELHPSQRRPYDVQIGRLGAERYMLSPADAPPAPVGGACRMFAPTGQQVCGIILAAWSANGIELDGLRGSTYEESLALFGLPLSPPRYELLSDGLVHVVQWFERGRFEIHTDGVKLGLLGSEIGPVAGPTPAASSAAPARISIPSITADFPIVPVGLDSANTPIVPDHDVGWYTLSARPGQGENIVLWGHVLRFRHALNRPAPFARLKDLPVGATITLYDADDTPYRYRVARQVWVRPHEVSYILPQGRELLTMVSCIGDSVVLDGEVIDMSHRLITIAEPLE